MEPDEPEPFADVIARARARARGETSAPLPPSKRTDAQLAALIGRTCGVKPGDVAAAMERGGRMPRPAWYVERLRELQFGKRRREEPPEEEPEIVLYEGPKLV